MEQAVARKHRMTRQRRIILEELDKNRIHPTAAELHDIVRKRLPRISLGTVYRNLEVLNGLGLVRIINTMENRRFDADTSNHGHIHCLSCGRVDDMPQRIGPELESVKMPDNSYEVVGYSIEYYGLCLKCKGAGFKTDRFGIIKSPTSN